MQGRSSAWLVKHELVHRSLGFDGIEKKQIKPVLSFHFSFLTIIHIPSLSMM
jgi:hypothetical protein